MTKTARPTFHPGKLAQARAEYKLLNITEAFPQRVSFGRRGVALTAVARYASDQRRYESLLEPQ